jgi:hypothetical protein
MRDMGRRTYLESDVGGPDCRHRLFPSPPDSGARVAAPLRSSLSGRQASRCPVRYNHDAPVCVRPVSSSRAGLGALAVPCAAQTRAPTWGHESVSSQTKSRPSISDRTSHTRTGDRSRPPYIYPPHGSRHGCWPTDQKQVHTKPPPHAGISIDSGRRGKRRRSHRDRGPRCSSS